MEKKPKYYYSYFTIEFGKSYIYLNWKQNPVLCFENTSYSSPHHALDPPWNCVLTWPSVWIFTLTIWTVTEHPLSVGIQITEIDNSLFYRLCCCIHGKMSVFFSIVRFGSFYSITSCTIRGCINFTSIPFNPGNL